MKSFLIIGMGKYGAKLSDRLTELGNDVMIVDIDEEKIQMLSANSTDAQIGDCTNEEVLRSLGINNFDACFVTIGENFQASLEITSLLKELGAKKVVSKAESDIQCKFLLRNGADEVVYPIRDSARRLAVRMSADNMFDFLQIDNNFSISEFSIPESWIGKTIASIDVRKKHNINILAVKSDGKTNPITSPDYAFKNHDHIIVSGEINTLLKLSSKL
ncbi:MAG: TrkA family potassium uptake protein [Clostridiales bacterium]|nr:TrkA family potassium uptake protein [Clostridiales bacterium]